MNEPQLSTSEREINRWGCYCKDVDDVILHYHTNESGTDPMVPKVDGLSRKGCLPRKLAEDGAQPSTTNSRKVVEES